MARLDKRPLGNFGNFPIKGDIDSYLKAEAAEFDRIKAKYPVIRFPVADGYAYYAVVKWVPVTLRHIPYGDAWTIPAAHIRGLRVQDVKAKIDHEKALEALFNRAA